MNYLRGFKSVLGSPSAENQPSAQETVERLCDRVDSSTLLEDRRDAVRALKSLSKKFRLEVGTQAMSLLIKVLQTDRSDTEIVGMSLETMCNIMSTEPQTQVSICLSVRPSFDEQTPAKNGTAQSDSDVGLQFTEIFIKNSDNVTLLLEILEEYEFHVRWPTVKLLKMLLTNKPNLLQQCILISPMGVSRLMDLLADSREIIRNEGLLLLIQLTKSNAAIQKIVAFESAFDRLFEIIAEEGHSDGGIVVEDCLRLMANLLRNNVSNQNFFREGSFIQRFTPFFGLSALAMQGENESGWSEQKVSNVQLMLKVVRILVSPDNPHQASTGAQKMMNQSGLLKLLCDILMASGIPADILTEAINTVSELIRGFPANQEYFSQVNAPSEPPRPAIVVLLMSMINDKQPFSLRCAVLYCFQLHLFLQGNSCVLVCLGNPPVSLLQQCTNILAQIKDNGSQQVLIDHEFTKLFKKFDAAVTKAVEETTEEPNSSNHNDSIENHDSIVASYKELIREQDEELCRLRSRYADLESSYNQANAQLQHQAQEILQLRNQLTFAQSYHSSHDAELNGSYVSDSGSELHSLRNHMNDLQINKQDLEKRLQEKEDRVQKLEKDLEVSHAQYAVAAAAAELADPCDSLNSSLNKNQLEDLLGLRRTTSSLENEVSTSQAHNASLQEELDRWKQNGSGILPNTQTTLEAQQRINNLEAQLVHVTEEKDSQIQEHEDLLVMLADQEEKLARYKKLLKEAGHEVSADDEEEDDEEGDEDDEEGDEDDDKDENVDNNSDTIEESIQEDVPKDEAEIQSNGFQGKAQSPEDNTKTNVQEAPSTVEEQGTPSQEECPPQEETNLKPVVIQDPTEEELKTEETEAPQAGDEQLTKAIAIAEDKRPSLKGKPLPESDVIDIIEGVCESDSWEDYGIKTVNGVNRISGEGLEAKDFPGMMQGGGKWPGRLSSKCSGLVGEIGEDVLYEKFRKHGSLHDYICTNYTKDCVRKDSEKKNKNKTKKSKGKKKGKEEL
ncbi:hypothetical protein QZH41_019985 [Actinostola sp. cb2023]|nr:hypothetical protein QZH41_019985 [Actinostola sp. cb2023]